MSQEAENQLKKEEEELMKIEDIDAAIAKQKELDDAARGTIVSDLALIDEIIAEGESEDSEELDQEFLESEDDEDIDLELDEDDYDEDLDEKVINL